MHDNLPRNCRRDKAAAPRNITFLRLKLLCTTISNKNYLMLDPLFSEKSTWLTNFVPNIKDYKNQFGHQKTTKYNLVLR